MSISRFLVNLIVITTILLVGVFLLGAANGFIHGVSQ